jgi:hypothetical protein
MPIRIAAKKRGPRLKIIPWAPVYFSSLDNGAHEWLIEFERLPDDESYFTEVLDNALKSLNSDYEAKQI